MGPRIREDKGRGGKDGSDGLRRWEVPRTSGRTEIRSYCAKLVFLERLRESPVAHSEQK